MAKRISQIDNDKTVSELFDQALCLYNEVSKTMEPSTSKHYQVSFAIVASQIYPRLQTSKIFFIDPLFFI
jgi:hypothetical protein